MSTVPPEATEHDQRAMAMMVQLRELAATISGFTFAANGRRKRIAQAATLPDAFLEAVAVACDAYPHLAVSGQVTGAEIRDILRSANAYTNVVNELRLQAKGLEDTVAERRSDVGYRVLRVYKIAQGLNRPEERQQLIPHLDTMRRALGRGRPVKRLTAEAKARREQEKSAV